MLRGILPKEYAFYDYFDKLMKINTLISEEFVSIAEGKVSLENAYRTIKYHERESDKISHDCIDLLHKTFITPIDRDQIYELIKGLDDFADQIDAATFRLTYYDIEELRPDVLEFARVIHEGNIELDQAIKGLRRIKKSKFIREQCFKVHELENQSDEILRNAIGSLFKENNVHLIIKWKEIFERLEKAVDRQEKVANTIESILIDNA
jgi:uncharacterized protein Yka (UPF0111/DUF47 family)